MLSATESRDHFAGADLCGKYLQGAPRPAEPPLMDWMTARCVDSVSHFSHARVVAIAMRERSRSNSPERTPTTPPPLSIAYPRATDRISEGDSPVRLDEISRNRGTLGSGGGPPSIGGIKIDRPARFQGRAAPRRAAPVRFFERGIIGNQRRPFPIHPLRASASGKLIRGTGAGQKRTEGRRTAMCAITLETNSPSALLAKSLARSLAGNYSPFRGRYGRRTGISCNG